MIQCFFSAYVHPYHHSSEILRNWVAGFSNYFCHALRLIYEIEIKTKIFISHHINYGSKSFQKCTFSPSELLELCTLVMYLPHVMPQIVCVFLTNSRNIIHVCFLLSRIKQWVTISSGFRKNYLEEFNLSHLLPLDVWFTLVKTKMNESPFINTFTIYLHFGCIRVFSHLYIFLKLI